MEREAERAAWLSRREAEGADMLCGGRRNVVDDAFKRVKRGFWQSVSVDDNENESVWMSSLVMGKRSKLELLQAIDPSFAERRRGGLLLLLKRHTDSHSTTTREATSRTTTPCLFDLRRQ